MMMTLPPEIVVALERGAFGTAVEALRQHLRQHADDTYAHSELIQCYHPPRVRERHARRLEEFWSELYGHRTPTGMRRFLNAQQLYWAERPAEAIEEYRAALAEGLDDCVVRHGLATSMADAGDPRSDSEYEEVLRRDGAFIPSLSSYAGRLFEQGQFGRLETLCADAKGIDACAASRVPGGLEVLEELDAMGRSIRALENAINAAHHDWWEEAIASLWPALRRHPQNCTLLRTFVYLSYRASCLEAAQDRLAQLLPALASVHPYTTGLIRWYQGETAEAMQEYDLAKRYGLDHPLLRYGQALAYQEMGRVDRAREELADALEQAPWLVGVRAELTSRALLDDDPAACLLHAQVSEEYGQLATRFEVNGALRLREIDALRARAQALRSGASRQLLSAIPDAINCGHCALARAVILAALGNTDAADAELLIAIATGCLFSAGALVQRERDIVAKLLPIGPGTILAQAQLSNELTTSARERLFGLLEETDSLRICEAIGVSSELLRHPEVAARAFRAALQLDRDAMEPLRRLCRLLQNRKDSQELSALTSEFPSSAAPLDSLFSLALDCGDMNAAFDYLARGFLVDKNAYVVPDLVADMIQRGRIDRGEAFVLLRRISAIDFRGRVLVGIRMTERGWWEEAKQALGELIDNGCGLPQAAAYYALACAASRRQA